MLLWYFWIYSFLGYLLEKLFARLTRAVQQGRKCFLLLPLCPVYGLGMLAVLALPLRMRTGMWLAVWGGLAATAVEYAVHLVYDRLLGVRFWDYSGTFGNLCGRVCLPFSVAWGVLTALAVRCLQPSVERLARRVPWQVTVLYMIVFAVDLACSGWVLHRTGDPEALRCDRRNARNTGKAL